MIAPANPTELILQPLAAACAVSGQVFSPGDRIVSYLVRSEASGEVTRRDVLASQAAGFSPDGTIACRWALVNKPKAKEENAERALKLTAENLFLALADPSTEPTPETARLVRFLAVLLERKRLLRHRGRGADGAHDLYEHGRSGQVYAVPAGELTPEFFLAVQGQLGALGFGGRK
jgi:hypothetical protein